MNHYKSLFLILLSSILIACGSAGSGDGGEQTPGATRTVADNASPALSDLVGGWNYSFDYGDVGVDEFFLFIDSAGDIQDFDFLGDSYDDLENCYFSNKTFALSDLGDGMFEIFDDGALVARGTVSISNNQLVFSDLETFTSEFEIQFADAIVASSSTVDDLTICSEEIIGTAATPTSPASVIAG